MRLVGGLIGLAVVVMTAPQSAAVDVPREFADEPAVVLLQSGDWTWFTERSAHLEIRNRILILDRRGFDHADQEILWNGLDDRVTVFAARTVLSDGRVEHVTPSLIHESILFKDDEREIRALRFTFPQVEQGAILEWEYTQRQRDPYPMMAWRVQGEIPILESHLVTTIEQPFGNRVKVTGASRVDGSKYCKKSQLVGGGARLELRCVNVPASTFEPYAPPEADRTLVYEIAWVSRVWSLADAWWQAKNQSKHDDISWFVLKSSAVDRAARKLVSAATTDLEKVDAIRSFLRDNVTLEADRDQSGKRPKNVDQVLRRKRATSEELTMLALALLRAAGISADPVMAHDRSQMRFVFELNSFVQSNHLMIRAVVNGKLFFFDPSCRFCPAGVPDWRYCSDADSLLVVHRNKFSFSSLKTLPAASNSEIRKETVAVDESGQSHIQGHVVFGAQYDVELRRRWAHMPDAVRRENFLAGFARRFESATVDFSDFEDLREPMRVDYSISNVALPSTVDERFLLQPTNSSSTRMGIPIQDRRAHAVWLPFRFTRQFETTFVLPSGFAVVDLPGAEMIEGPGMEFVSDWRPGGSTTEVLWTAELTMHRTLIPAAEYEAAKAFWVRVQNVFRRGAVVKRAEANRSEESHEAL